MTKTIVFSGDIGNTDQPIIRDPQYLKQADYVVMESTYGDRNHEISSDYTLDLAQIIDSTLQRGGNVVIPSFAVGRTQELLYFIREIKERKLVTSIPDFPVYVDSPLASAATKVFDGDLTGYVDDEAIAVMKKGFEPLNFHNLFMVESSEESKALNFDNTPKVIISSSGMCEAGRIRHHLKHNLWRPECSVIFVGYQANGTLGRMLMEGVKKVKLFGEEIIVKAQMHNFRGLSAHADKEGLLKWISAFESKPKVYVIHGESGVCDIFVQSLSDIGLVASAPNFKSVYDLATGQCIDVGIIEEHIHTKVEKPQGSSVYARLLISGQRLLEVIKSNEHSGNKDLSKLTDQINALTDKWKQ